MNKGKPVQRVFCVVYDRISLDIFAVAGTHNEANQIATEIFNEHKILSVLGEVRFHDDSITPMTILGMNLSRFEHFIEGNKSHPLIK